MRPRHAPYLRRIYPPHTTRVTRRHGDTPVAAITRCRLLTCASFTRSWLQEIIPSTVLPRSTEGAQPRVKKRQARPRPAPLTSSTPDRVPTPSQRSSTAISGARMPMRRRISITPWRWRACCRKKAASWKWRGREIKLVDGTTVSMPDTADNRKNFPLSKGQKRGSASRGHVWWESCRCRAPPWSIGPWARTQANERVRPRCCGHCWSTSSPATW
jgi:hypothetical protein